MHPLPSGNYFVPCERKAVEPWLDGRDQRVGGGVADLDGGPELPREIRDISDYPQITIAMQNLGYDERRIRKILGLNWLRVIRRVTEG